MSDLAVQSIATWDDTFRLALAELPPPGDWAKAGRCRTAPVSVFFPERGDHAAVAQAREICSRCPVIEQCRRYGIEAPQELKGVWGGLTGLERRTQRRAWLRERELAGPLEYSDAPVPDVDDEPRTKRAYRGSLHRQLEQLVHHPGESARVVRYPSASSAAAMASLLRTGRRTVPAGRWEFEGRRNDDGGSDLYARYLGPDEEAQTA